MEYKYKSGNSYKLEQIEGTTLIKISKDNVFIGNVGIGSLFRFAEKEIEKEQDKFRNLI